MAEEDKYIVKDGEKRMKGRTVILPVVTGTCAFFLGKKVGRDEQGSRCSAALAPPPPPVERLRRLVWRQPDFSPWGCAGPAAGCRAPVAQVDGVPAQPHGGGSDAHHQEGASAAARAAASARQAIHTPFSRRNACHRSSHEAGKIGWRLGGGWLAALPPPPPFCAGSPFAANQSLLSRPPSR